MLSQVSTYPKFSSSCVELDQSNSIQLTNIAKPLAISRLNGKRKKERKKKKKRNPQRLCWGGMTVNPPMAGFFSALSFPRFPGSLIPTSHESHNSSFMVPNDLYLWSGFMYFCATRAFFFFSFFIFSPGCRWIGSREREREREKERKRRNNYHGTA